MFTPQAQFDVARIGREVVTILKPARGVNNPAGFFYALLGAPVACSEDTKPRGSPLCADPRRSAKRLNGSGAVL